MDCPNDINFDTYISEERYIEILDQSKDEEDDTCIEKNKITMNQPLNFIEGLLPSFNSFGYRASEEKIKM
jgi:hypothetical protein